MQEKHTNSVVLAVIVGMCLVLGAVVVGGRVDTPFGFGSANDAAPEDTPEPEQQAVTSVDRDPANYDTWQEDLLSERSYRGRVQTSGTETDTPTEPEAASEDRDLESTLTGQFSVALARDILLAEEVDSEEEVNERINEMVDTIVAEAADDLYEMESVTVLETTDEATRTYFNAAGEAILEHDLRDIDNELALFSRAIQDEDPAAYADLERIATMYGDLRDAYLDTPVPTRFSETHLDLINVFHQLHNSLHDMANATEDPVRAYIRLERYPMVAESLLYTNASMGMYVELHESLFATDDPARYFLAYLPNLTPSQ